MRTARRCCNATRSANRSRATSRWPATTSAFISAANLRIFRQRKLVRRTFRRTADARAGEAFWASIRRDGRSWFTKPNIPEIGVTPAVAAGNYTSVRPRARRRPVDLLPTRPVTIHLFVLPRPAAEAVAPLHEIRTGHRARDTRAVADARRRSSAAAARLSAPGPTRRSVRSASACPGPCPSSTGRRSITRSRLRSRSAATSRRNRSSPARTISIRTCRRATRSRSTSGRSRCAAACTSPWTASRPGSG